MATAGDVPECLRQELLRSDDSALAERIRVESNPVEGESNIGIACAEKGFGPDDPWGLVNPQIEHPGRPVREIPGRGCNSFAGLP